MFISFELEHAANRIEHDRNYRQQLLAAVEYYQQGDDYPYSKPLAGRMVRQFWNDVRDDDFSGTVAVWKLWFCASVIMIGLVLLGLFVRDNYAYLARYAGRLGRPTAALDPLPATLLTSLTGDILAEPNEVVVMEAGIGGRLPQKGKLIIEKHTKTKPGTEDETDNLIGQVYDPHKALTLQPVEDANDNPIFTGKIFFHKTGLYRYRFTAAGAESQWQSVRICIFPEIEKITANISFDAGSCRFTTSETVSDFVLSVLAGSTAEITVEANCKLETAEVKHLDNREDIRPVNGSESFTFDTSIDREGQIGFQLRDTNGLRSRELPPLTVKIKEDERPKFSLVHPEGDGLATNVASVPIKFEIKDDFGIADANLVLEIGDGQIEHISATISEDKRVAKIDHILEMEKYGLDVGDAVLFYASASDVATGTIVRSRPARSDVTILEIKPYRRVWLQCSDGT